MKRLLSMLLMLCLLLGCFAGCNVAEKDPEGSSEQPSESQSERETEAHLEHTYEAGKCTVCGDQLAYEIFYTSNGDGTCYVSDIVTYPEYDAEFTLVIPERSPAGDTVTDIRCKPFSLCIPAMLLEKDFDELMYGLWNKVRSGELHEHYMTKISQYFLYYTSNNLSEEGKQQLFEMYPLSAYSTFYLLDASSNNFHDLDERVQQDFLDNWRRLYQYVGYSAMDMKQDYENLYALVEELNPENKDEILATLPTLPTNLGESIVAIEVPSTVEKIDKAIFAACIQVDPDQIPGDYSSWGPVSFSNLKQKRMDVPTIDADSFSIFDSKEAFEQAFSFLPSEEGLPIDLSQVDFAEYSILVIEAHMCMEYNVTFSHIMKQGDHFVFTYWIERPLSPTVEAAPVVTFLMVKKSDLPQMEFGCLINTLKTEYTYD